MRRTRRQSLSRACVAGLGRVIKVVDGNGFARVTTYDSVIAGLVVTTQTDALGHTVSSRIDAGRRARIVVDALGFQTLSSFDANGNRISVRDPNGIGQDCVYDARNRDVTCTDTAGAITAKGFDGNNNVITTTDALGHVTTCTFDGNDRKVTCQDRISATTAFQYDLTGNMTKITDAEGGVTDYAYDGRNLLVTETYPLGQQGRTRRAYIYDGGRRLTSRTVTTINAPVGTPAFSEVTGYAYDHANRLTARTYADGKHDVFAYDHASRLTSARSNRYGNTIARAYDAGGRLTSEAMTIDAGTLTGSTVSAATTTVGYAYDAANRKQTLTYPDGRQSTRTYTDRNQLASVSFDGSIVAQRQYDQGGRQVTTTFGNGLVETRGYVAGDNLVQSIAIPNVTGFFYAYDASKRKTQEVVTAQTSDSQGFGYDVQDRLTSWNRGGLDSQAFALTPVGDFSTVTRNGVVETRTHTAVHEIASLSSPSQPTLPLGYDAKGNLTADDQGSELAWDPENRLSGARTKPGSTLTSWGEVASYSYDALGRRIEKVVQDKSTRFIHDGAQVILETEQPHVPSQADVAGDGTAENAAKTPASGGVLQGTGVKRVNFQPDNVVPPQGFYADKGRAYGARSNGLNYGWNTAVDSMARVRRSAVPLIEFDTFIHMWRLNQGSPTYWEVELPNGDYPVIVVAGDATNRDQTNDLRIEDVAVADPDPYVSGSSSYAAGDFDGYAVIAHVADGRLTIQVGTTSATYNPKLCFVEIGPKDGTIDQATTDRLNDLIHRATTATAGGSQGDPRSRAYAYGSNIDEPLVQVVSNERYYHHTNHLYSVAALTEANGTVTERYRYDAFGQRTILLQDGVTIRLSSICGNQIGFTGRYLDRETDVWYFRARNYLPRLQRFAGRDSYHIITDTDGIRYQPRPRDGYMDGYSLYHSYFIPGSVDPSGLCVPRSQAGTPQPNGCGAEGGIPFPNGGWNWDFNPACNNHDDGYGRCNVKKSVTDAIFLGEMLAACNDTGWDIVGRIICKVQAVIYYSGVALAGCDAYKAAQRAHCTNPSCTDSCPYLECDGSPEPPPEYGECRAACSPLRDSRSGGRQYNECLRACEGLDDNNP